MAMQELDLKINDVKRLRGGGENIKNFYITYFTVLRPFHLLPDSCIEFLAHVLEKRYNYIKAGDTEAVADMKTMSVDTRRLIRKELNMTVTHMLYLFDRIRKTKILVGNSFNLAMIPKVPDEGDDTYTICFVLKYPKDE